MGPQRVLPLIKTCQLNRGEIHRLREPECEALSTRVDDPMKEDLPPSGWRQVDKMCLKIMNQILLRKWGNTLHIKEIAGTKLQK